MITLVDIAEALGCDDADIHASGRGGWWTVKIESARLAQPVTVVTEDLELSVRSAVRLTVDALERAAAAAEVA